jgi:PEP-CTERM motif
MKLFTKALAISSLGLSVGLASTARADIIVGYSLTASGFTTLGTATGTNDMLNFTGPSLPNGVSLTFASFSDNVTGSPTNAGEEGEAINLTNNTGSAKSFYIFVGAGDYIRPAPGPFTLAYSISSQLSFTGFPVTVTSFACVFQNTGSVVDGCSGTSTLPISITSASSSESEAANGSMAIGTMTPGYEIGDIVEITMANGAQVSINGAANLSPVPEPISLTLLGSGLIGLGVVRRRRRG